VGSNPAGPATASSRSHPSNSCSIDAMTADVRVSSIARREDYCIVLFLTPRELVPVAVHQCGRVEECAHFVSDTRREMQRVYGKKSVIELSGAGTSPVLYVFRTRMAFPSSR
jgi:hypothetical protein